MRFLLLNARSVNSVNKFISFKRFLSNSKINYDFIILNETWFGNSDLEKFNLYNLKGYSFYHASRSEKLGGGVAIYVHNDHPQICVNSIVSVFEKVSIKIKINDEWIIIIAYYRPPNSSNLSAFMTDLEKELDADSEMNKIICGDMNINTKSDTNDSRNYKLLIDSSSATILNNNITRPKSNAILDHIITQSLHDEFSIDTVEVPEISDHNAILCAMDVGRKSNEKKIISKKFVDHHKLMNSFKVDLRQFENAKSSEEKLKIVSEAIQNSLVGATSIKKFTLKHPAFLNSWFSVKVLKILKEKDMLYAKLRRRRRQSLPFDRISLKIEETEKKLDNAIENSFEVYFNENIKDGNLAKIWNDLNDYNGRRKKHKQVTMIENNEIITDETTKNNILNRYFINAGEAIPSSEIKVDELNAFKTIKNVCCSMFIDPTTPDEISRIIKSLDKNKAAGYDEISIAALQSLNTKINFLLSDVVNSMIETGSYPDSLKEGIVVPVPKCVNAREKEDFRPITILSSINKIIEIVLNQRLENYLEKIGIMDKNQFGFVKNSSCEPPIMELNHLAMKALNEGKRLGVIFLDISKAYDAMPHCTLLHKMECYGIRGKQHTLYSNYFKNRTQSVKGSDNLRSDIMDIFRGIAQGSNSGPTLFNLNVNDFKDLPLNAKIKIRYADDTILIYEIVSMEEFIQTVKDDMRTTIEYFRINGMRLNLSKSKFMIFHSKNNTQDLPSKIEISDTSELVRVSSYKYLGVTFDEHLTFSNHIDEMKKKLVMSVNILGKLKWHLPSNILKMMYFAHFHSHICYVPFVWGFCVDKIVRPIQILQNRALKHVFKVPFLHGTEELFNGPAKGILPIKGIMLQMTLTFIYKTVNNKIHTNIKFPIIQSRTRQNHQLQRNSPSKTNYGKRDIKTIAPIIYNKLPDDIKNATSVNCFKFRVKKHLVNLSTELITATQFDTHIL